MLVSLLLSSCVTRKILGIEQASKTKEQLIKWAARVGLNLLQFHNVATSMWHRDISTNFVVVRHSNLIPIRGKKARIWPTTRTTTTMTMTTKTLTKTGLWAIKRRRNKRDPLRPSRLVAIRDLHLHLHLNPDSHLHLHLHLHLNLHLHEKKINIQSCRLLVFRSNFNLNVMLRNSYLVKSI